LRLVGCSLLGLEPVGWLVALVLQKLASVSQVGGHLGLELALEVDLALHAGRPIVLRVSRASSRLLAPPLPLRHLVLGRRLLNGAQPLLSLLLLRIVVNLVLGWHLLGLGVGETGSDVNLICHK
jgi:hypothetical protein